MPTPGADIDPLIEDIRARVAARRRDGFYPEGLEADLDSHFARVARGRRTTDVTALRDLLISLEVRGAFHRGRIQLDTSVPGGSQVHRVIGKTISRQTEGVLQQVQEFADAVRQTFAGLVDIVEYADTHVHADVTAQLDAVWERLAAFERGPVDSPAAVADLRRRVEALEAAEAARRFDPPYTADEFESAFRGSDEELKARYRDVAERFAGRSPVLDLGCGRGEFLELLIELGVGASGVELDERLAADGRRRGLEVTHGDAVAHLAGLGDDSLGGITALQLVEHLTPAQVVELATVARTKLVDGGLLVVETVNPGSLYTFAHSFYLDPTHSTPVHPAYLEFVFKHAGWRHVEIEWRSPPPAGDVLEVADGTDTVTAANVARLNQLLFAPQDYALLALR